MIGPGSDKKIININIYAVLSLAKKSQVTRFLCIKFLAQKSGGVKFLTNFKSDCGLSGSTVVGALQDACSTKSTCYCCVGVSFLC